MAPELYIALLHLHRACAVISITGFIVRWVAGLAGRPWVRGRVARTLPHAVDTVLLLSAVALAAGAGINPIHTPWLALKIVALLAYIGLGILALSPRRTTEVRRASGVMALLVVGHIVAVAFVKHPAGLARALL